MGAELEQAVAQVLDASLGGGAPEHSGEAVIRPLPCARALAKVVAGQRPVVPQHPDEVVDLIVNPGGPVLSPSDPILES